MISIVESLKILGTDVIEKGVSSGVEISSPAKEILQKQINDSKELIKNG